MEWKMKIIFLVVFLVFISGLDRGFKPSSLVDALPPPPLSRNFFGERVKRQGDYDEDDYGDYNGTSPLVNGTDYLEEYGDYDKSTDEAQEATQGGVAEEESALELEADLADADAEDFEEQIEAPLEAGAGEGGVEEGETSGGESEVEEDSDDEDEESVSEAPPEAPVAKGEEGLEVVEGEEDVLEVEDMPEADRVAQEGPEYEITGDETTAAQPEEKPEEANPATEDKAPAEGVAPAEG